MPRTSTTIGNSHLVIDTAMARPDATTIVERKGLGHPDTLADHLAERLSRAYSHHTVERFGAVLHHNFDKLALLGGASEVRYGAGRMTAPVRVLVNGRAAPMCGGERIPVEEIVEAEVRAFFDERLPEISDHLDIVFNITSNSSPGAVLTGDEAPDRTRWFNPRSIEDLRERRVRLSNDTSLGTGWAPENIFETLVMRACREAALAGPVDPLMEAPGDDVQVSLVIRRLVAADQPGVGELREVRFDIGRGVLRAQDPQLSGDDRGVATVAALVVGLGEQAEEGALGGQGDGGQGLGDEGFGLDGADSCQVRGGPHSVACAWAARLTVGRGEIRAGHVGADARREAIALPGVSST